jgi:integrase
VVNSTPGDRAPGLLHELAEMTCDDDDFINVGHEIIGPRLIDGEMCNNHRSQGYPTRPPPPYSRRVNSPSGSPSDSVSLFDTAEGWRDEPRIAMAEFLASENFRYGNRSHVQLPVNHKLASGSIQVYCSMFEKFMRHLTDRRVHMLDATATDIDSFFGVALSEASKETRSRYTRLLERTFGHLVATELRKTNPVGEWANKRGGANTRQDARANSEDEPETVTRAQVAQLHNWLLKVGTRLLDLGEWRLARDVCLASLSLGTGLRCTELLRLKLERVKHWPGSEECDRFIFDIKYGDTVRTSKPHQAPALRECVALMERWWSERRSGFIGKEHGPTAKPFIPPGDYVFPANESGTQLTPSTLYRSLKRVASKALEDGILDETTRWVLERGAQGLRKAYVLASLEAKVEPGLLQLRLGHHHLRSVKRVLENALPKGEKAEFHEPSRGKVSRRELSSRK